MSRATYRTQPFRVQCRTCGCSEWRPNRPAALRFARNHRAGYVVLSPMANTRAGR